jgi:hypothetical protein
MYNLGAYFGHRLKKKKSSLFLHSMPLVLSQVLIDGAFGDQGDSFAPQVTGAGCRWKSGIKPKQTFIGSPRRGALDPLQKLFMALRAGVVGVILPLTQH